MTTKQAPTLFGKRMRRQRDEWDANGFYRSKLSSGHTVFVYESGGEWYGRIRFYHMGPPRKSPQSAARDAERYLRRLHKALGKVVGE